MKWARRGCTGGAKGAPRGREGVAGRTEKEKFSEYGSELREDKPRVTTSGRVEWRSGGVAGGGGGGERWVGYSPDKAVGGEGVAD